MIVLKWFVTLYFAIVSVILLKGGIFGENKPEKYINLVTGLCMIASLVLMWG